ncbi:MAG: hypothetical protein V4538_11985 [Bacteroidota bacterium]
MKYIIFKCVISLILVTSFCSGLKSQNFTIHDGDTINVTVDGKKQGFWRYYWPNDDLKYEVFYENNEKQGLEIRYYDGQDCIELSNTFKNGVLDGPSVSFFPNCSTRCEEIYKDGLKNGYERCYDEAGFMQTEANFTKGDLVGSYAHFDKKGYVTYEAPTKEKPTTIKFDKFLTGEYKLKDSTIFHAFRRNPQWKKIAMVVDLTGSMFPYIGQLLIWYKQNYESEKVMFYTLFHDGGDVIDETKKVGLVGGVYTFEAKDFKKFKKDIDETRKKGGERQGGDDPENDLEAVLKTITTLRGYSDIVLVADDSPVRDMVLLKRIKKPIHIIICGTAKGINAEYLKIAYQTKGSIHTAKDDINMKTIKENQEFTIDDDIFKFRAGEFIWMDTVAK